MHIKAKPPALVPEQHRTEVEALSKAFLMDMVWDFCVQEAGGDEADLDGAITAFRERRAVIKQCRA